MPKNVITLKGELAERLNTALKNFPADMRKREKEHRRRKTGKDGCQSCKRIYFASYIPGRGPRWSCNKKPGELCPHKEVLNRNALNA